MGEIERAAIEDLPAIKDVLRETWHDTYASLFPGSAMEAIISKWHAPEVLNDQIRNADLYFGIARDEGNVVGVITARQQGEAIIVDRLYVRPLYQRRGIGRQLLEASYGAFRTAQKVRLTVKAQNRKGMAFYSKHGFRETARTSQEVAGASLENVVMEKQL